MEGREACPERRRRKSLHRLKTPPLRGSFFLWRDEKHVLSAAEGSPSIGSKLLHYGGVFFMEGREACPERRRRKSLHRLKNSSIPGEFFYAEFLGEIFFPLILEQGLTIFDIRSRKLHQLKTLNLYLIFQL